MGKARILVVEDDFDISNMLKIYFSGQGYDVEVAGRGNLALEMTRQNLPHLIVLDIMLPDIDGYEVTGKIKQNDKTAHIPVVALTANVMKKDREYVFQAGCIGYISKPIDVDALPSQVETYLKR